MNRYLLDTNAWFWLAIGDERLATDVVATLEVAVGDGRVFLSQISLCLNRPVDQWLKENVCGVNLLDLPIDTVVESTQLPGHFHKDPADRFIVATARTHGRGRDGPFGPPPAQIPAGGITALGSCLGF